MKRTKPPIVNKQVSPMSGATIQALSALMERAKYASQLGAQYGTDRDLYEALGYPTNITYADYVAHYQRQDIAAGIIDRPVNATWRGEVGIMEAGDDTETALEKAWKQLDDELKLKSKLVRLDKLAGIGNYGVLVLGLDDVKSKEDAAKPVVGKRKLRYVKPLGQDSAKIAKWDTDVASKRYGMPLLYDVSITNAGDDITSEVKVHHSRIIHVVDGLLESEIEGTPRLQTVFNRLMDLEKIVGGDSEMFWRGARPGYQGTVAPDFQITKEMKDDLQDQVDEFDHNLRRMFINEGIDLKALAQQIADPANHVDIQIQMISAVTGIPKRILTGSERGELSSSQDKDEWMAYVQGRREEYVVPNIIRPFIDRCIEYGILPKASTEGYSVKWEDLFSISEKDRVDIGKVRAEALSKYASSPVSEAVMPPEAFLRECMGFDDDKVELILEMQQAFVKEEGLLTPEEEEIIEETPIIPKEKE